MVGHGPRALCEAEGPLKLLRAGGLSVNGPPCSCTANSLWKVIQADLHDLCAHTSSKSQHLSFLSFS